MEGDDDEEGLTAGDARKSFLMILELKYKYLLKIDSRQKLLADGFYFAGLYGALQGSVPLVLQGKEIEVKGFKKISQYFKTHAYKTARLTPRVKDPDFEEGNFVAEIEEEQDEEKEEAVDRDKIKTELLLLGDMASEVLTFFQVN